jgi:hypothetical protein
LRIDYRNLVYACRRCNAVKRDQTVPDPLRLLHANCVATLPDGALKSNDRDAQRLIRRLDLNSPRLRSWRIMWMRIVDLARRHDPSLYRQLVCPPPDLPNLHKLRPPLNTRKAGLNQSWFARRQRGDIPGEY